MSTRLAHVLLTGLLFAVPVHAQTSFFSDDFDRPDGPVGNGWTDLPDNVGGDLATLSDQAVTTGTAGGTQGIFRPWSLRATTRVRLTLGATTGSGGESSRFEAAIAVSNAGTTPFADGYGLYIIRTHSGFNNSAVRLLDNGIGTTINSPFQFTSSLDVDFFVLSDGSITGEIQEGSNVFRFEFPPTTIHASGENLAIATSNQGTAGGTASSLDDVVLFASDAFLAPPLAFWVASVLVAIFPVQAPVM